MVRTYLGKQAGGYYRVTIPGNEEANMGRKAGQGQELGETVVQFLQNVALRFGSREALLFKPGFRYQRWSYADLWEGAGQVATLLQERGLVKGDRALIWAPNCPQWVLAFFGCLRAGVVAVPLDLRSSPDFAQLVADRTRPKVAFVSRVTPKAHEELEVPEVKFEDLDQLIEDLPQPRRVEVVQDDLAEVMFTSGTTGDPKGVMLTHGNLMANLSAISQHVPGKLSDRLMSILPLSHMFEQMGGLLTPLRIGASVTFPTSRQPTVLFRTMQERKVTMLLLVPQALDLFMKGIEREVRRQGKERVWSKLLNVAKRTPFPLRRVLFRQVHRKFGGKLSLIFVGGAALDPELGAKWELLGVHLIQGYGATEASPVISCHTCKNPRYDSTGPPLPGVEVKFTDDGEVLIRGPNITPGYWEAPEKTAQSFEDGWYKTGDLGYLDQEGSLHLKGRKKDMIVLASGQNVYPEDIEMVLNKHDALTEATVVGLTDGPDAEVHAALLMEDPAKAPEVVAWANKQFAEHQRVRGFTVWQDEDFPRTHTLKVKKGVIVDMLLSAESRAPESVGAAKKSSNGAAPALEGLIAEVGGLHPSKVVAESKLGKDLDLDSLRRVELLSAIEGELGVYLDESQVGPDTTVGELAALVEQGTKTTGERSFPGWGMSWWCRPIRGAVQRGVTFPLLRWMYSLRVTDLRYADGLDGPLLYASNHTLGLDSGLLIKSMSSRRRKRLAVAGSDHLWRNPLWAVMNPLLGNGFPFSKEGAIRPSLENLGRILDRGWSVLIYPEGELTIGGPMKPFLGGTGLIAVESGIPVVPIRLHIRRMGFPGKFPFLRRGEVEVRFGEPLNFSPRTPYMEATASIERAVKSL